MESFNGLPGFLPLEPAGQCVAGSALEAQPLPLPPAGLDHVIQTHQPPGNLRDTRCCNRERRQPQQAGQIGSLSKAMNSLMAGDNTLFFR